MNHSQLMKHLGNQLDELVEMSPTFLHGRERAFIAWCLLHAADLEIGEADAFEAIVDGSQEKGIDAIYVPDGGERIVILSTKFHHDPSGKGVRKNDLVKLFAGVDWLLEGDLTRIDRNLRFKARADEFRQAYYDFDYSSISIVFATTAENGVSGEEIDEINMYQSKLQNRGAPFNIVILHAKDLESILTEGIHRRFKVNIDLRLAGKPLAYERDSTGARAIVGTVKGNELAGIFRQEGFRVFDINIRSFLGNVKINQGIKRTASDASDAGNFWFYNNGVTFVCDGYSFRSLEDTVVRLENAQIINGCQTVTSLYHAGEGLREEVEVLVRIIEKRGDIDFVRRVTQFANSQNAVRPSDLVGTDTVQLELKRRLLDLGYYFETRRGDYRADRENLQVPLTLLPFKKTAQAYASTFRQIPGIAKKDTSKLFLFRQDGGLYDDLFHPNVMPEQLICATDIMNLISSFRSSEESEGKDVPSWLPHSDFFMTGLFFLATFHSAKYDSRVYLRAYSQWLKERPHEALSIYRDIVARVNKVVVQNETLYGYSHPKFFKTQSEYDKKLKPIIEKYINNSIYTL